MATLALPRYNAHNADLQRARDAALELLAELAITEPAVNPVEVARSRGVEVRFVDFRGPSDETVSGYSDPEENVIVVNRQEFPPRQTFTIAHELGHQVLHGDWSRSDEYEVYYRDPNQRVNTPVEREANQFAANLLMPKFMMDRFYTLPEYTLADIFAVSIPAIRTRLQSLYGL